MSSRVQNFQNFQQFQNPALRQNQQPVQQPAQQPAQQTPINGDRAAPIAVQHQKTPVQAQALSTLQALQQKGVDQFLREAHAPTAPAQPQAKGLWQQLTTLLPAALSGTASQSNSPSLSSQGGSMMNVRLNSAVATSAAKLNTQLQGALAQLGKVYADGLVDESELTSLNDAHAAMHEILQMRHDPALAQLDAGVRAKLEQHIFAPMEQLAGVATGELSAVMQRLTDRDKTALAAKLQDLQVRGYPNKITTVDTNAIARGEAAGLADMRRYALGDLVVVPRSDGRASVGVVVGGEQNKLRVEVLSGDQVGVKMLDAQKLAQHNPFKLGDYFPNINGREMWITGVDANGRLTGMARHQGQTMALSADDVMRVHQFVQSQIQQQAAAHNASAPTVIMQRGVSVGGASTDAVSAVKGPLQKARASFDNMLGDIWNKRQEIKKEGSDAIYSMYNAVTEENPLRSMNKTQYLQGLASIAQGRPKDATSNLQAFGGDGDSISDAVKMHGQPGMEAMQKRIEGTFFRFQRANWNPAEVRERVYINANANHATELMRFVVKDIIDNPARFPGVQMAKISGPGAVSSRAENIVIYTASAEASKRVLDAIAQYQARSPAHFQSSVPQMTEQAMRGVATASEPPAFYKGQVSFGSLRSDVMMNALDQAMKQSNGGSFEQFRAFVEEGFRKAGLDPNNPHKNL